MDLQSPGTRIDHPYNVYLTNQQVLAPTPTPLGTLGVLPYELRCMIYKFVFLAESTSLTRVSKTLAADTKASINKYYEFHTTIQKNRDQRQFRSDFGSRPIPANLENLTIHIILGMAAVKPGGERGLEDLVGQVVARAKQHKHCHISIELIGYQYVSSFEWTYALTPLRKFKIVTVEVVSGVFTNRESALNMYSMHHKDSHSFEKTIEAIQSVLSPQAGYREGKELTIVGHTIQYVALDGWVKALKEREEDERVDHRFPRLGEEFPEGVAYSDISPHNIVVLPVEDGSREVLKASNGNCNGFPLRIAK